MTLTQGKLQEKLGDRPFRFYPKVGSTNDQAREWLINGAPIGACVVADQQTQGRGRMGRTWETPPNSAIALSVILNPPQEALSQVMMLGALAVAETLAALGAADVGIKWPNDVLLNGLKVCGVLAESEWHEQALRGVILGIGLNVRVNFSGSPLAYTATSIETELGHAVDRIDVLATLLGRIDAWSAQLGSGALYEAWRARLITLGDRVSVSYGIHTYEGMAVNVLADGALVIEDSNGTRHTIYAGDVSTQG